MLKNYALCRETKWFGAKQEMAVAVRVYVRHNFTIEIILEIALKKVLKKLFQTIIGDQRDFNEIVFDYVEVRRNVNQIL